MMDKKRLTFASRIMLPAYPIAFAVAGGALIFQDPSRTSGDAYEVAFTLVESLPGRPAVAWGLAFITIAALEAISLFTDRPRLYIRALTAGAGVAAFWGATVAWSAATSPNVSWTAVVWISVVVVAQAASARSISYDYILGYPRLEPPHVRT